MANSGSTRVSVTKYDDLVFSWEILSQSIENNSTTISWKLELVAGSAGLISSSASKAWEVTVDGTKYTGSSNVGIGNNSTKTLASGSTTIPHNGDGSKTFSYSFSQYFGITFAGLWVATSAGYGAGTLTTIPRKSSLSAANGTLGTALSLKVTRKSTNFTHSITYTCGTAFGTIATKSSETTLSWTPPNELASQAPSANSVNVVLTITTYSGNTSIGSESVNISCSIPNTGTFVPVLMPTTSDAMGYAETYGGFVQGQSKLKVDIETYGAYGAWIVSVKTVFDGATYTSQNVTTNEITHAGELPLKITVTDSRGRVSVSEMVITVLPYDYPKITKLTASRCDANGVLNPSGSYLLAEFSATLSPLNNKNTSKFFVGYKKTSEATHAAVELTNFAGQYSVNSSYVIPAETTSSYTVIFTVIDAFKQTTVVTVGAPVKKVFSLLKKAGEIVGMAFGKIAELEGVFDIAWQTRFSGGILHSVLPDRTDLNTLLVPTTYMLLSANSYTNIPESGKGAFLEIVGIKDGSLIQRFSVFDNANPRVYERIHYSTTGWANWICIRGDFVVEQGTSNGWTYRKWNSGVAECWKNLTHTTTITVGWGSLFHGTATTRQSYPFSFVDKPLEQVSLTAGSYQAILFPEKSGNGVNGASASACYNVCRPSSLDTSMEFYISFYVTGKWK